MVGDAQVSLLRIVLVAGRDGEMMTRTFDHIQYCPLAQHQFQDIQIDIGTTREKSSHSNEEEWW
jgi:hypothetical protein